MVSALLALALMLAPFTGPTLPGSVPGTAKFTVDIEGSPGQAVRLSVADVPSGYIASFCTDRVCAPFRVVLTLPKSGRKRIELQFIENIVGARKPQIVRVWANGKTHASIIFARATH